MNTEQLLNVKITRVGNTFKRAMSMVVDPSAEQEHPNILLNTTYIGVVGYLPVVGERIIASYHTKNGNETGYKLENVLSTSTIVSVDGDNYHTKNSVYKIELLDAN